jgi:hypothetical protein
MTYCKLLDKKRAGTIVRADGAIQHQYVPGRGWVRSGVLIEYFNDESEYYDLYEDITEGEAMKLIGEQERKTA